MTTLKEESGYNNGVKLGIDIDLFPLDEWNSNLRKAKKEARYIGRQMKLLTLSKLYKPDSKSSIKRLIKGIVMFFAKGSEANIILRKF